ncbi:MAG: RNA 2',3'-cyclic phosphodiesterase [Gemmatimonadaceae bacterium]
MRVFVAADPGPLLQREVYDAAAPLRAAAPGVRWVAPERLHVTLKFLGEQSADAVARLRRTLAEVAALSVPADIELSGYGAFPNFRRPRVVWMGTGEREGEGEGEEEGEAALLSELASAVAAACARLAIVAERGEERERNEGNKEREGKGKGKGKGRGTVESARSYTAHLTLGRIRRPLSGSDARRLEAAVRSLDARFKWTVSRIDLMQSDLTGPEPHYSVLESYALGRSVLESYALGRAREHDETRGSNLS